MDINNPCPWCGKPNVASSWFHPLYINGHEWHYKCREKYNLHPTIKAWKRRQTAYFSQYNIAR